jgi:hypothetical protein
MRTQTIPENALNGRTTLYARDSVTFLGHTPGCVQQYHDLFSIFGEWKGAILILAGSNQRQRAFSCKLSAFDH